MLHNTVIPWLHTLQQTDNAYRFHDRSDVTAFSSIFALYILDLFGETAGLTAAVKVAWVKELQSLQDPATGLFIPVHAPVKDVNSKAVHQLTAFTLNALDILGASPLHPLSIVKQWETPALLEAYLRKKGSLEGRPTSGNAAMFTAIFLTHEFRRTGDVRYKELIDLWFDLHDRHQNPKSGYWGDRQTAFPYLGFQNAVHQFEIYYYWKRPVRFNERIVDNVLTLQDHEGFFAPNPGGGGCYDFDAAHILVHGGLMQGYRVQDVRSALLRCRNAILRDQNSDGGFSESRRAVTGPGALLSPEFLRFLAHDRRPNVIANKLRYALLGIRGGDLIRTHWTNVHRRWSQSDSWNTWFRCLTVAEIETVLPECASGTTWKFQKHIGFGYFSHE